MNRESLIGHILTHQEFQPIVECRNFHGECSTLAADAGVFDTTGTAAHREHNNRHRSVTLVWIKGRPFVDP